MSRTGLGKELLFIDPKLLTESGSMYEENGAHILIAGATGSGKTATLLRVTYNLWKAGKTIIWRDDANLEFLSMAKHVRMKLFIPDGCDLHIKHPNVEKVFYDWKNLPALFPRFSGDRINVLLFDLYTIDHEVTVKFWTRFFDEIYRFKRVRIEDPWALVVDELNDLAPGSR